MSETFVFNNRPKILAMAFLAVALFLGGKSEGATGVPASPANTLGSGAGSTAIQRAAKAGKFLYLFFYESEDEATRLARTTLAAVTRPLAKKALQVELNRGNSAERETVARLGVDNAPMPLVVVLAPNGAITGGFTTANITEKNLLEALVSPAMQKCLKAMQERKVALVCIQNGSTRLNAAAMKGVREFAADARFSKTTEMVQVDPADPAEGKFLSQIKVSPQTQEAVTVLLAPPNGAIVASINGETSVSTLEAALKNASKGSSCCAPGSNKSCAPK